MKIGDTAVISPLFMLIRSAMPSAGATCNVNMFLNFPMPSDELNTAGANGKGAVGPSSPAVLVGGILSFSRPHGTCIRLRNTLFPVGFALGIRQDDVNECLSQ